MAPDEPTTTGRPARFRFSVDHWAALWANPHPQLAGRVVTPDILVYWPGDPEPVRGVTRYQQRVADLLALVPDLRLEVAEHAHNGDSLFIRWIASGTGARGPFTFSGVDRIRLRDGLIEENRIYYDPALLAQEVNAAPDGTMVDRTRGDRG